MRGSDKNMQANRSVQEVFGVDFHNFIEKQDDLTGYELASEFGITLGDVHKLKKQFLRA